MSDSMDAAELRALRTGKGMSQSELADALGITRETVGQMERGNATIEKRTALAVRFIMSECGLAARSPAVIMSDVADLLDKVMVRGAAFDDQMRSLSRLEAEWKEIKGLGVAGALFGLTRGTLGMLRASVPGDPMQMSQQASLVEQKQQWRALARLSAQPDT